ncbi:insulinase family protein, partial [Thermodesulfobacteriota bacterium]
IEDAKDLQQLQESKEDASCLPTLVLEDIPPTVQSVKASAAYDAVPAVCYRQPTSGIFYFAAVAGCGFLPKPLIPMVPFFCHAFSKMGTSIRDYTAMAQLIDAYTGGINLACQSRTGFNDTGGCLPLVAFNAKCLVRNQSKMFEIIEELLYKFDFSDLVRLKSLLLEYRAGLESRVVQNGHRFAMSLASRNFSPTRALSEIWHGIHQLQTIKDIMGDLTDDRLQSIAEDLFSIGKMLFTSDNFKIALIGEDQAISAAASATASIPENLEAKPEFLDAVHGFMPPKVDLGDEIPREGWSTSTAVSFVARTFATVRLDHEEAPALSVISKILRSLYLHREIREKGGAYGALALYNREDGLFCFGSYRDPRIISTLRVYDDAPAFLKAVNLSDDDIREAILQVCSEIDAPDSPGAAARKAFSRKIISLADETRQIFKQRLLKINRDQVVQTAEKYFSDVESHAIAVISSEDKLKAANEKLADRPLKLYKI